MEWEIDPEIEDCRISRMLLQPLLENSLSHGLKFKKDGRVRVAIRTYQCEPASDPCIWRNGRHSYFQ